MVTQLLAAVGYGGKPEDGTGDVPGGKPLGADGKPLDGAVGAVPMGAVPDGGRVPDRVSRELVKGTPELPVPRGAVPVGAVPEGGEPLDGPVPIGAVLRGAVPEGGRLPDRVPSELVNGIPELPVPRGTVPLGPVLK